MNEADGANIRERRFLFFNRQARSIAFPVFENASEPSEIRIAAFQVTMATKPDLYLLRHIAVEAISEDSDQVAAFIASAFHSLAKSKYPCHGEM